MTYMRYKMERNRIVSSIVLVACIYSTVAEFQDEVELVHTTLDELQVYADSVLKQVEDVRKEYYQLRNKYGETSSSLRSEIEKAKNENYGVLNDARSELDKRQKDESLLKVGLDELADKEIAPLQKKITDFLSRYEEDRDQRLQEVKNNFDDFKEKADGYLKIHEDMKSIPTRALTNLRGNDKFKILNHSIYLTERQVRSQNFNFEENQRSDGNSGIVQMRVKSVGGDLYKINSYTGDSFCSIHDHADKFNVAGIGEFFAVLNGVPFRTRHNDYKIHKAVENNLQYHATVPIQSPDVPQDVKDETKIEEKINRMKQWFKAFKDQDENKDFQKYFKPVLCYLEGAYEKLPTDDLIKKPLFPSSRRTDAKTYTELFEKIYYASFTGEQNEDWPYLPKTIMDFDKDQNMIEAQWNYRVLCHPVKEHLKTEYFELVSDSLSEINVPTNTKIEDSLQARYTLEGRDESGRVVNRPVLYTKLDELMEEIPGKDNYGAFVKAEGFDSEIVSANPKKKDSSLNLNGGNYHRAYKLKQKDAMGVDNAQRGFSDRYYIAMTTQEKVLPVSYVQETIVRNRVTATKRVEVRVSFAVPLEVIYLNPLNTWNPYGLEIKETGQVAKGTVDDPYTFITKDNSFYMTPCELFDKVTPADIRYAKFNGQNVQVCASGIRILIPSISGSGVIRQRYPIIPVRTEGGTIGKSISAMEDILKSRPAATVVKLYATGKSGNKNYRTHTHVIEIPIAKYQELLGGAEIEMITERAADHSHTLRLKQEDGGIKIRACDPDDNASAPTFCFDQHPADLRTSKLP